MGLSRGPGRARVKECGQARGIWRGQAPDRGRAIPGAPERRAGESEGGNPGQQAVAAESRQTGVLAQPPGPRTAEGPPGPPLHRAGLHSVPWLPSGQSWARSQSAGPEDMEVPRARQAEDSA